MVDVKYKWVFFFNSDTNYDCSLDPSKEYDKVNYHKALAFVGGLLSAKVSFIVLTTAIFVAIPLVTRIRRRCRFTTVLILQVRTYRDSE